MRMAVGKQPAPTTGCVLKRLASAIHKPSVAAAACAIYPQEQDTHHIGVHIHRHRTCTQHRTAASTLHVRATRSSSPTEQYARISTRATFPIPVNVALWHGNAPHEVTRPPTPHQPSHPRHVPNTCGAAPAERGGTTPWRQQHMLAGDQRWDGAMACAPAAYSPALFIVQWVAAYISANVDKSHGSGRRAHSSMARARGEYGRG